MEQKQVIKIISTILILGLIAAIITWIVLCRNKVCLAGTCVFGKCFCKSGVEGSNCDPCKTDVIPSPKPTPPNPNRCARPCIHGVCVKSGSRTICKCQKGWAGETCNQWNSKYS